MTQRCPAIILALVLAVGMPLARPASADDGVSPAAASPGLGAPAIETAQQRVVKVYGATIGREPGYASGVLVSADGQIVTTLSLLLEGQSLHVVLPDGRQFPAKVTQRDERRQIALLKIDAAELPYFELGSSDHLQPGDWLVSAANPFKVAVGPESVSVSLGVFAGRANLSGRRRAQDFPYTGPVLLTDLLVATPGSAGGAIVDLRGHLVGLIGKPVISNLTNTWVNYALPVEEVRAFVTGEPTGSPVAERDPNALPDLGIRVFNVGGRSRPAYIERVRNGSPAREAGLRPDDLLLTVDGTQIASCADFDAAVDKLRPGQIVEIVVKRGPIVMSVEVVVGSRTP